MKRINPLSVAFVSALACLAASGDVLDRPTGIKIGQRMTLRPYVTASFTYDSNVDAQSGRAYGDSENDVLWTVSPGLGLVYNAETWSLNLSAYYNYRGYMKNCHQNYNHHNYGQDLRWNWSNSKGNEKGWSLLLAESFRQVTMADDMVMDGGDNYTGDSRQLQVSGALQRRFNEHFHGDVNASYYWLDYLDDNNIRSPYYGWDRWTVGAEAGFAPSRWTDFILAGSYMGYHQDNLEGSQYDGSSQGYSIQGGLGSYMTERLSYRALVGWSRFEYADAETTNDGFVYTLSGNWKIGETWNLMLLGTSYYQPSERQYASRSRVDAVSLGVAKSLIRGKLRTTLDLRYRRETHEHINSGSGNDYVLNIITGRLGLDYTINRLLAVFAYLEYQRSFNDNDDARYGAYDYDRWRFTTGFRLSY